MPCFFIGLFLTDLLFFIANFTSRSVNFLSVSLNDQVIYYFQFYFFLPISFLEFSALLLQSAWYTIILHCYFGTLFFLILMWDSLLPGSHPLFLVYSILWWDTSSSNFLKNNACLLNFKPLPLICLYSNLTLKWQFGYIYS